MQEMTDIKDKQYNDAIERSIEILKDIKERGNDALGDNAVDFIDSLMAVEERSERDLRVALMGREQH